MKHLMIFLFLFSFVFSSFARLGESVSDAEKRYGKVVYESGYENGFINRFYLKGSFLIAISFNKQGQAINISYNKLDTSNKFYMESFSAGQYGDIVDYKKFFSLKLDPYIIDHILKINSESKDWTVVVAGDFWRRSDGIEAMYDRDSGTFSVSSDEYIKFVKENVGKDLLGF